MRGAVTDASDRVGAGAGAGEAPPVGSDVDPCAAAGATDTNTDTRTARTMKHSDGSTLIDDLQGSREMDFGGRRARIMPARVSAARAPNPFPCTQLALGADSGR